MERTPVPFSNREIEMATKKEAQEAQEADKITVYFGAEKLSPIDYAGSFELGGHHYTTTVKPGETPEEAFDRAYNFLYKKTRETFQQRLQDFLDDLANSKKAVNNYGRR